MLREAHKKTDKGVHVGQPFTIVYLIYNLGAAIVVLLAEFFLIRVYGISTSILVFALINLVISPVLFFLCRHFPTYADEPSQNDSGDSRLTFSLFLLGLASTIYQLSYLEYCWRLFGAISTIFAVVLFSVFLGIVIGSIVSRWIGSFHFLVSLIAIFIPLLFSLTEPFINTWSYTANNLAQSTTSFSLYRYILIGLFGLPIFILFGASVPLGVRTAAKASYGRILATVSFGNALGVLVLVIFLKDILDFIDLVLVLVGILLFANLLLNKKSFIEWRREWFASAAAVLCCLIFFFSYPHKLTLLGSFLIQASKEKRDSALKNLDRAQEIKQDSDSAVILHWNDGLQGLVHSGIMPFYRIDTAIIPYHKAHAVLGSLYSRQHNNAFVLGLGSGISSTEAANRYKNVTVVDINPAMLRVSEILAKANEELLDKKNVTIHIQDAIVELGRSKQKYDLLLSSLPSPEYYSAAKIYTKEFFEMVDQSLSLGGVYVSWVPLPVVYDNDSVLIYVNTLKSVFSECHYYLMFGSRVFMHVCGQDLSKNRQKPATSDQLGQWLSQLQIEKFEENISRRINNSNIIVNTLDQPLLSFKPLGFRKPSK